MPISPAAATTVFCAVWSGDPDRHALLRGQQACLQAQTVDVSAVYVFDDGDEPPPWLRGRVARSDRPLTIYQAWSVGTQVADGDLLMNLNLDDRLAPQAVEVMQHVVGARGAALVGGEWRICYSQAETDAVEDVRPAADLPFHAAWPPEPGRLTRLGSGTGDRGTFGPATMWRADLHRRAPYPWAFGSGEPIRIVGDLAWWLLVTQRLGGRAERIDRVVGRYHSHPSGQAEFRSADEHGRLQAEGVAATPFPLDGITVEDRA